MLLCQKLYEHAHNIQLMNDETESIFQTTEHRLLNKVNDIDLKNKLSLMKLWIAECQLIKLKSDIDMNSALKDVYSHLAFFNSDDEKYHKEISTSTTSSQSCSLSHIFSLTHEKQLSDRTVNQDWKIDSISHQVQISLSQDCDQLQCLHVMMKLKSDHNSQASTQK